MYYLTPDTIAQANKNINTLDSKAGGLLCVLSCLTKKIEENRSYTINGENLRRQLSFVFDRTPKKYFDNHKPIYIIFAVDWYATFFKKYIKDKIDLLSCAVFFLRRYGFEHELTKEELIDTFIKQYNLEKFKDSWFGYKNNLKLEYNQNEVEDNQIEFYEKMNYNGEFASLLFNDVIKKSAADLKAAGQIQTLYSGSGIQSCFLLSNEPLEHYYIMRNSKIAVPNSSSVYLGDQLERISERFKVTDQNIKFLLKELPNSFDPFFSRRYITSLLAKPFVILTGNSGTGKTRISKQFAEYLEVIDINGEKNWLIVPVGADWTDNARVLGFYNPLADNGVGKYEKTGIIKLIERANNNPEIPYFLILDEMNLSHVERYFSDFLSHMETPDNPFELEGYRNEDDEVTGKLPYPKNLFVIGTVNIDETTYMFSPKVLDRANVVEFKPNKDDVMNMFSSASKEVKIASAKSGVAEAFLKLAKEIRSGESRVDEQQMAEVRNVFTAIYDITEKNGYEFAYRTVREIKQYISAAHELSSQWDDAEIYRAIDEQLLQKVLPKIHGNRKEIGTMLDELEAICKQNRKELELSGRKIEQMKGKLAAVQYASFI